MMRVAEFYDRFYYRLVLDRRIPANAEETILWVLKNEEGLLKDSQVRVMEKYFAEEKTMQEIADELGLARQRIQQILSSGMHRLKWAYPSYTRCVILYGISMCTEAEREFEKEKEETREALKEELLKLDTELRELRKERETLKEQKAVLTGTNVSLFDMELSVRATNALARAGCRCADDVACMNMRDLRRMRNVGVKTCDEVQSRLKLLGYEVTL